MRQDVEDAGPFAGWGRAVEGRHLGDRADGPQRHEPDEAPQERGPRPEDLHRPGAGERRGRRGREHRGDDQPDRRRDREPDVRFRQQHGRGGQRVEAEEPGARQERQGDERQARVAISTGGDVGDVRQHDVHRGGDQDDPEMARVVLPMEIELGARDEQGEPDQWQEQHEGPRPQPSGVPHWLGGHGHRIRSRESPLGRPIDTQRTLLSGRMSQRLGARGPQASFSTVPVTADRPRATRSRLPARRDQTRLG